MRLGVVCAVACCVLIGGGACKSKKSHSPSAVAALPQKVAVVKVAREKFHDDDVGAIATFALLQSLPSESPVLTVIDDSDIADAVTALRSAINDDNVSYAGVKASMLELYDKNNDGRITSDELAVMQMAIKEKVNKSRETFAGGWNKQEYQICINAQGLVRKLPSGSQGALLYFRIAMRCEKIALPATAQLDRVHLFQAIRANLTEKPTIFPALYDLLEKATAEVREPSTATNE